MPPRQGQPTAGRPQFFPTADGHQQGNSAMAAASWRQPQTALASSKAFLAAEGILGRLARLPSPASELPQFEYRMPRYGCRRRHGCKRPLASITADTCALAIDRPQLVSETGTAGRLVPAGYDLAWLTIVGVAINSLDPGCRGRRRSFRVRLAQVSGRWRSELVRRRCRSAQGRPFPAVSASGHGR